MCRNHLRLQVIGVAAIFGGGVMAAPRDDNAPRKPSMPERESALSALHYANTNPLVLKDAGTVSRNDDDTWELSLEGMRQPVSINPVRGRTDIPVGSVLSGTVLLGAHGPFMALIIETGDGETFSAAMEFADEELDAAFGRKSELRAIQKSSPSSVQELADLQGTTVRLTKAFYVPGAMAPFGAGAFASSGATNTGGGLNANSCSCFLACEAECPEGTMPECTCKFLGVNRCGCVVVEVE